MPKMRKFNTKSMKIGTQQVREMYNRLQAGELTQGQAAREYGLGVVQVGRIARGESRAAETGAHENPIPNFNYQADSTEISESSRRLRALLDAQPQEEAAGASMKINGQQAREMYNRKILDRLNADIAAHPVTKVGQALDELDPVMDQLLKDE